MSLSKSLPQVMQHLQYIIISKIDLLASKCHVKEAKSEAGLAVSALHTASKLLTGCATRERLLVVELLLSFGFQCSKVSKLSAISNFPNTKKNYYV